ncbi:hypothetical protein OC842_006067 [Tilletia horrida]|uniref:Uncharacterized protein n=1 Tax=Tilletia horrida TaxID=155126 RepID=A0AAN6JIE2_9BASI|nr:hypothetical protein OC842_006067 [Tilletia horrida]
MLCRTFAPLVLLALSAAAAETPGRESGGLQPVKRDDKPACKRQGSAASAGQQQDLSSVGCDVDGVWCVVVDGERSVYDFVERTYSKEVKLDDGRHVFQYSTGTADGITLNNGDFALSYFFSSFVSAATVTQWTKGPRAFASFTTVDQNEKTNANGWTGEHTVYSVGASTDDLYLVIPPA